MIETGFEMVDVEALTLVELGFDHLQKSLERMVT